MRPTRKGRAPRRTRRSRAPWRRPARGADVEAGAVDRGHTCRRRTVRCSRPASTRTGCHWRCSASNCGAPGRRGARRPRARRHLHRPTPVYAILYRISPSGKKKFVNNPIIYYSTLLRVFKQENHVYKESEKEIGLFGLNFFDQFTRRHFKIIFIYKDV